MTLVIEGRPTAESPVDDGLARVLRDALAGAGVEPSRAARVIKDVTGLSRNESYRLTMEGEEEAQEEGEEDHRLHPTSMFPSNPLNKPKM